MWIFLAFANVERLPIFTAPVVQAGNGAAAKETQKRHKWYTHVVGAIVRSVTLGLNSSGPVCTPGIWNAIKWKECKAEIETETEMKTGTGTETEMLGSAKTRTINIPSWDGERLVAMHFQSHACKASLKEAYNRTIGLQGS